MVSIFTISDKALMGKQINFLSSYIAECLFKNNIKIKKQSILSSTDDFSRIIELNDGNIFIFLVDKANPNLNNHICNITNSKLIENTYIKENIMKYYNKINQPFEKESEKEWNISNLAQAIINPNGITQGYVLNYKNNIFCVLPNNEDYTRQMFDDVVLDFIKSQQKKQYKNYTFKTFGLPENSILSILKDELKNKNKVTLNLFSRPMGVDIVLKSLDENNEIDNIAKQILLKLDKYIYSVEDIPIEKVVYNLLKFNDIKVGFVEDITAGAICSKLNAQSSDAKNFISKGFVLPDKKTKLQTLNIKASCFDDGEINPNVVYEMTANMLNSSDSDIVVSTIGDIFGECFIAVGDKNEIHVYKNKFIGSYNEIIDSIVTASYFYLIKKLKKNDFHFEQSTV